MLVCFCLLGIELEASLTLLLETETIIISKNERGQSQVRRKQIPSSKETHISDYIPKAHMYSTITSDKAI